MGGFNTEEVTTASAQRWAFCDVRFVKERMAAVAFDLVFVGAGMHGCRGGACPYVILRRELSHTTKKSVLYHLLGAMPTLHVIIVCMCSLA